MSLWKPHSSYGLISWHGNTSPDDLFWWWSEYLLNTSKITVQWNYSESVCLDWCTCLKCDVWRGHAPLQKAMSYETSLSFLCSVLECVCNSCASPFSNRESDVPLKSVSRDTVISYRTYHRPALTSLKSTLHNHTQRWEWITIYWVVAYICNIHCLLKKTEC